MIDVYESAVDQGGRYGAVFERDDDTAYFYLLDLTRDERSQIIEVFDAHSVMNMPADAPATVHWMGDSDMVGLTVGGTLIALFDIKDERRKGRWATDEDTRMFARH